jgi:hypothetical protein
LTKSPKVKSFSLPVNPLRHGGRTRRATSPYYGEAALRASPIERAYKNRTVHYGQAVLFPPRKGKGDAHLKPSPGRGRGTIALRWGMRLTSPFAKLTFISPTAKHHSPQGYIISEGNIICRRQTSLPPQAARGRGTTKWGMRLTSRQGEGDGAERRAVFFPF